MRNQILARFNSDRALARRQKKEIKTRPRCWGCGGFIVEGERATFYYNGRKPAKGYHQECEAKESLPDNQAS